MKDLIKAVTDVTTAWRGGNIAPPGFTPVNAGIPDTLQDALKHLQDELDAYNKAVEAKDLMQKAHKALLAAGLAGGAAGLKPLIEDVSKYVGEYP